MEYTLPQIQIDLLVKLRYHAGGKGAEIYLDIEKDGIFALRKLVHYSLLYRLKLSILHRYRYTQTKDYETTPRSKQVYITAPLTNVYSGPIHINIAHLPPTSQTQTPMKAPT